MRPRSALLRPRPVVGTHADSRVPDKPAVLEGEQPQPPLDRHSQWSWTSSQDRMGGCGHLGRHGSGSRTPMPAL